MKSTHTTLLLVLSAAFSMPAVAGPNWDVIHEGEAEKAAHRHEHALVLPLDYGPRAITTPWLNRQRLGKLGSQAGEHKKFAAAGASQSSMAVATHPHQDRASHS